METSLHRQLKELYADDSSRLEVTLGDYRIDVVTDGLLVEIQHGSLAAIRDKVRKLLKKHRLLIVKPIVAKKRLIKQAAKGGKIISRRMSPKRGSVLNLFDELVYFTRVFPHKNLTLEVPLVEIEEWRYPGHGRRRRHRENDQIVEDQKLICVNRIYKFRNCQDLARLIPDRLPSPFHTGHLAEALDTERGIAQRVAYCLRNMGTTTLVGKQRNSLMYEFTSAAGRAA